MAANVTPLRKVAPPTVAPPTVPPHAVPPHAVPPRTTAPEPLWREVLGSQLRELRHERQERLAETAARAGISPQYLSEIERGRKEPSSEMIAALAGAFGLTLIDLTRLVTEDLRGRAVQQALRPRPGLRASGPVALLAIAA